MPRDLIIKNEKGQPPIEQAEEELYPGIPYAVYTKDMRFATYDRAKEIIFQKTGQYMKPTRD